MFSRSPQTESKAALNGVKSIEPFKSSFPRNEAAPMNPSSPGASNLPPPVMPTSGMSASAGNSTGSDTASGFSLGSIIGNDLTIVGQGLRIITRGTLQVDGRIEGDVVGNEIIIGEKGEVIGVVSADEIIVRGQVQGTIKGHSVTLQASARVEGDVHHQQLTVEQGAHLDGRVRRPKDPAELKPDLSPTQRTSE